MKITQGEVEGMENVAVIGGGGREHALTWKLSHSPLVNNIYVFPGNAGTGMENRVTNVPMKASKDNFAAIAQFIKEHSIDTVVVGPEDPLDQGLANYLTLAKAGRVWGPMANLDGQYGATSLEASKLFSFEIMKRVGIPQADGKVCLTYEDARDYIMNGPFEQVVLKAPGLTGGKGVEVCNSREHALKCLDEHVAKYCTGKQGFLGMLVSERLFGKEYSVFGFSDGEQVRVIQAGFQDHKPRDDGDKGKNTGGMGAYGPASIATLADLMMIQDKMMTPLVQHMKGQGMEYKGFLYGGMMKTNDGSLKVIEWNIRMGDPECQPAMVMMNGDLYQVIDLCMRGQLAQADLTVRPGYACTVVVAGPDYPDAGAKDKRIFGLEDAAKLDDVIVFHAGTKLKDGQVYADGGRILGVNGYDLDPRIAQASSYGGVRKIHIEGGERYRTDIMKKQLDKVA